MLSLPSPFSVLAKFFAKTKAVISEFFPARQTSTHMKTNMLPYFQPCKVYLECGRLVYQWPDAVIEILSMVSQDNHFCHNTNQQFASYLTDLIKKIRQNLRLSDGHPNLAKAMEIFVSEVLEDQRNEFIQNGLPHIAKLALSLPRRLNENGAEILDNSTAIHILNEEEEGLVLIDKELAAAILASAFFCLFPTNGRREEHLPEIINFDTLFMKLLEPGDHNKNKLKCIVNYFHQYRMNAPSGMISFERKVLRDSNYQGKRRFFWKQQRTPLCTLQMISKGNIENEGSDCLKVDFANKYLGGGTLRGGCAQEEILFVTFPELIVGMLICPRMGEREAIEIEGAEKFSSYHGYGQTFKFNRRLGETKSCDGHDSSHTKIVTKIIAIDALNDVGEKQFDSCHIVRELDKAFCGFTHTKNKFRTLNHATDVLCSWASLQGEEKLIPIATGNWGCGVFGGDPQIKSMIQWIAASQASRPSLLYYAAGDTRMIRLPEIVQILKEKNICVGDLYNLLMEYGAKKLHRSERFFAWIIRISTPPGNGVQVGFR